VVHACNPSTQEKVAGGFQVSGHPGLHSKTKTKKKINKKKKRNLVSVSGRYVFFSPHVQARQSTIELNPLSGFVFLERHI
jgi:hypothetical protein